MRTRRRGVTISAAPPEWNLHCRKSFAVALNATHLRRGDRSWWLEYVGLMEEGFVHSPGTDAERREAQSVLSTCGAEMSLRAFELVGDDGELIARRTYALCVMCGDWAEF